MYCESQLYQFVAAVFAGLRILTLVYFLRTEKRQRARLVGMKNETLALQIQLIARTKLIDMKKQIVLKEMDQTSKKLKSILEENVNNQFVQQVKALIELYGYVWRN